MAEPRSKSRLPPGHRGLLQQIAEQFRADDSTIRPISPNDNRISRAFDGHAEFIVRGLLPSLIGGSLPSLTECIKGGFVSGIIELPSGLTSKLYFDARFSHWCQRVEGADGPIVAEGRGIQSFLEFMQPSLRRNRNAFLERIGLAALASLSKGTA